jgi:DNA-binding XRE family transcriptional regulator
VICNNVKKIREERLMNKSELARRAGVSPLTIGRIENGYPCRVETKRKIIKALGFKLSDRNMVFPEEGQFNSPSRFIP